MNRSVRIATPLRSRSNPIRRHCKDLVALEEHGTVQFCLVSLFVHLERVPNALHTRRHLHLIFSTVFNGNCDRKHMYYVFQRYLSKTFERLRNPIISKPCKKFFKQRFLCGTNSVANGMQVFQGQRIFCKRPGAIWKCTWLYNITNLDVVKLNHGNKQLTQRRLLWRRIGNNEFLHLVLLCQT